MIAVIMILCVVLAVAALIIITRKQNRKQFIMIEEEMKSAISKGALNIDEKVVLHNRIIAIDREKSVLLYVKLEKGEAKFDLIDLGQIHSCEIVKLGNKWTPTGKKSLKPVEEHINAINLQLQATNNISFDINFYNEMEDDISEMKNLFDKAISWRDTIIGLKNIKPVKH